MSSPKPWQRYTTLVCRILLGGILIFASWDKIHHPHLFARMVADYQLLPPLLVNPLALILPWLEVITGTMLILGIWIPATATLTAGMMLVFIIGMVQALLRGLDMDCGCFSTTSGTDPITVQRILLDVLFLFMAVRLYFVSRRPASR